MAWRPEILPNRRFDKVFRAPLWSDVLLPSYVLPTYVHKSRIIQV